MIIIQLRRHKRMLKYFTNWEIKFKNHHKIYINTEKQKHLILGRHYGIGTYYKTGMPVQCSDPLN